MQLVGVDLFCLFFFNNLLAWFIDGNKTMVSLISVLVFSDIVFEAQISVECYVYEPMAVLVASLFIFSYTSSF